MSSAVAAFYQECAHCGADLDLHDWPPVVAQERSGDERTLHSFCDEECQAAWRAD